MATGSRILVIGSGLTAVILGSFVGEEHGFQMTVADNIDSAQALFNLADADVIVLDWELEQASHILRQLHQKAPSVPVILIASTPISEQYRESAAVVIRHSELAGSFVPVIQLALRRKTPASPAFGRSSFRNCGCLRDHRATFCDVLEGRSRACDYGEILQCWIGNGGSLRFVRLEGC